MRPANLTRAAPLSVGGPGEDRASRYAIAVTRSLAVSSDAADARARRASGRCLTSFSASRRRPLGARARGGCAPCLTSRSRGCGRWCRGARTSRSTPRLRGQVADVADERDRAVAGLERGADADERGALGDVAAVSAVVLAARTGPRRPRASRSRRSCGARRSTCERRVRGAASGSPCSCAAVAGLRAVRGLRGVRLAVGASRVVALRRGSRGGGGRLGHVVIPSGCGSVYRS